METKPKFSIVSPVYGASSLLIELVARIHKSVSEITDNYEIVLVNDHSPDNSWEIIQEIIKNDQKVTGINLSKNFGQQNAINAGLDYATGDYIVTLDCDLQDEPERIKELYLPASKGKDIVFASRVQRQDDFIKKLGSKIFNNLLGYLTETQQDSSVANFILYKKSAVDAMAQLGDYHRYYPMINKWVGFDTVTVPIQHAQRKDDVKSSYTFKKRIRLALTTIIAFSDKPLRLILKFGFSLVLLTFFFAIFLVYNYVSNGKEVSGWLSVFLSIWFLFGIVIIILGILGMYVGKIFENTKNRPNYIVKEVLKNKNVN
ncbi:MAG: glycosyltransferase [Cytophagaceae bacterium]|nr:glycosyltransferase [Cytophagaceae bacterium]MBK9933870.1 glycosyltransferase [Cytophagaceae bacterium]MBL0302413.1 glycosyltransferase [Cytophagaceae bacterium]MBL0325239.1 glycosyltransferase [Cytophagaceae bacterium]